MSQAIFGEFKLEQVALHSNSTQCCLVLIDFGVVDLYKCAAKPS